MGRSGADIVVAHGINFLVEWPLRLRVRRLLLGCRLWAIGSNQAGVRARLLLAASSAKVAGHPGVARLITDISTIIRGAVLGRAIWGCCGGIHP
jgi:hypothetical protein